MNQIPDEERFDPEYEDDMNINDWVIEPGNEDAPTLMDVHEFRHRVDSRLHPTNRPVIHTVSARTGRLPERISPMSDVTAELKAALVKFAEVQALVGRFGATEPPIGTVLRWEKSYKDRTGELKLRRRLLGDDEDDVTFEVTGTPTIYSCAALRANNGAWYTTHVREKSVYSWEELVKVIGDSPCVIASGWEEVPVPQKPSEESMDPAAWAKLMFGAKPDSSE